MIKISWDAGHGGFGVTPGKRTPDGSMYEWDFNSAVVKYAMLELAHYKDVAQLRVDDPTGKRDVPLKERTDRINSWGSDFHISVHANAAGSGWNDAHGIETFVYKLGLDKAVEVAKVVQAELIKATGLTDRGVKAGDLHMVHETHMPAILIEHPFMTNKHEADILKSDEFRKTCASAIVQALVKYFKLERNGVVKVAEKQVVSNFAKEAFEWVKANDISDGSRPLDNVTRQEIWVMLKRYSDLKK